MYYLKYYQSNGLIHNSKDKSVYWSIYWILYSGYHKLLFPGFSMFFSAIQLAAMLFVIIVSVKRRNIIISRNGISPIKSMIIFFFAMSISYLWTNNVNNANEKLISMLVSIAFVLVLYAAGTTLYSKGSIQYLYKTIIYMNLILLAIYFIIHIGDIRYMIYSGMRGTATETNPIWITRIAGDSLILILLNKHNSKRILLSIELGFLGVLMILMGSKGPIIAILLAIFFYNYDKGDKKNGKRLLICAFAILVSMAILYYVSHSSNSYIRQRYSIASILASDAGYRVDRYIFTVSKIPEKLLYGHGLGSWSTDYWEQVSYIPIWTTIQSRLVDYPHNLILEVFYDSGFLGIVPLFTLIYSIISKKKAVISTGYNALYYMLVSNMLYSMFSGSVTEGNRGAYYLMALFCGILNVIHINGLDCQVEALDE